MKRMFLKITFLLSAFMIWGAAGAAAVTMDPPAVNVSDGMVEFHVKGEGADSGKLVTLVVYKPGKTPQDADGGPLHEAVDYMAEIQLDEQGEGNLSYKMHGVSGTYTAAVKLAGETAPVQSEFQYYDMEQIEALLQAVNESGSAGEVQAALQPSIDMLGQDLSVYYKIPEAHLLKVYEQVQNKKNEMPGQKFTAIEALGEAFSYGVDFTAIHYVKDTAIAIAALERNRAGFELDEKVYGLYEKFDNGQKEKTAVLLQESAYETKEQLQEAFYNAVVCTSVNTAANWSVIVPNLKSVNHILNIDFSGYDKLSKPANVFKTILSKTYNRTDDLIKDFYEGVKSVSQEPADSHGSGNRAGSVSIPAYTQPSAEPVQPSGEPQPDELISFTDIDGVPWAYDAIITLADQGIIKGKGDSLFFPEENITREEFMKILITALDFKIEEGGASFSDVEPDSWYAPYIAAASKMGITNGLGDGTFGVGKAITREEIVTLAYKAGVYKGLRFDETQQDSFSDYEAIADYAKTAVYAMKNAGIVSGMEDGQFYPKDLCTRAQAAKIIYMLIQYQGESGKTEESADERYMDSIALLTAMGILNKEKSVNPADFYTIDQMVNALLRVMKSDISGIQEEQYPAMIQQFLKDAQGGAVTCNQLIKCLVHMTGYGVQAQNNGGYPSGYIATASSIGILDNVKADMNAKVTKGVFAQMVRNAMETDMVQLKNSFGQSEIVNDESIMSQLFGVIKVKGIVQGNEYTYIDSPNYTQKDTVDIGGVIIQNGATAAELMLGESVIAYYRQDRAGEENTMLFIQADPKKNTKKEINALEIVSYSDHILKYEAENGRIKNAKIPAMANVIYNGRFTSEVSNSIFTPKNGSVALFDNDGDGNYDVIKIEATEDYVVGYLDDEEKIIYDKFDTKKKLELEKVDFIIVDREGKITSWSDLQEYNILTVAQSMDKEVITIVKTDQSVAGTVSSSDKWNGYQRVRINGESYLFSPDLNDAAQVKHDGSQVFLLNAYGQIAAVRSRLLYGGYAYLLHAYADTEHENTLYLKVLDNDGGVKTRKCAEKLRIDGKRYEDCDLAIARIKGGAEKAGDLVIQYQMNEQEEITSVDLPYNASDGGNGVIIEPGESYDSLNKFYSSAATVKYKQPQLTFSGKLNLDPDVLVFILPTDINSSDAKKFKVGGAEILKNDVSYMVDAYRMDKDGLLADILVVKNNDTVISFGIDTAVFVVGKTEQVVYDEEPCTLVTGYQKGVQDQFYLTDEMKKKYDIGVGDIIRVTTDGLGYAAGLELMFDYSQMTMVTASNPTNSSYTASDRMYYTGVYAKDEDIIVTPSAGKDVTDEAAAYENYLASSFTIYVVDPSVERGEIIRKGTVADLHDYKSYGNDYSRIFIRMSYGKPREIIVIK